MRFDILYSFLRSFSIKIKHLFLINCNRWFWFGHLSLQASFLREIILHPIGLIQCLFIAIHKWLSRTRNIFRLHSNRCSKANTERMPTCEFECFRIFTDHSITYLTWALIVCWTLYFYAKYEILLTPTFVIRTTVSCVRCCCRCPESVLICWTINTLSWMIILHWLW